MELISIVIPVYNEEAAIAADLDTIRETMDAAGHAYEIIVVNDGSTDGTGEILASRPWVQVVTHPQNRGTGAARTSGMRTASGDVIVMTDGDGTYPNRDIPRMLQELEEADMVIGARTKEEGTLRMLRTPAKQFIRRLACFLTETEIPDLNSGMRAFKRDIALRYLNILPNTHSWVSTITIAFLSDGYSVHFLPIDYYKRVGKSTFHPLRDTYNYLTLVVRTVMYFYPLKVFLPLSLGLLTFGGLKLVRDLIVFNWHVATSTVLILLTAVQVGAMGLLADLIVRRNASN
jgi:glycosyltransferase involved in cell wall biosynthesis